MVHQVQSHILERTIGVLMGLFGLAALYVFFVALRDATLTYEVAVIQILLIIVLAILAQTVVLIRLYEKKK
ncbi:MAG: hypothetical protein ACMXYD_00620 [Candidatus Woesearchaeota archaeon]